MIKAGKCTACGSDATSLPRDLHEYSARHTDARNRKPCVGRFTTPYDRGDETTADICQECAARTAKYARTQIKTDMPVQPVCPKGCP